MTKKELMERQSWSLHQKIDHSLGVIDQFCSRMDNKVFVAFSGGKDSTVLLDLCRVLNPNIKAVFCNTGNEYPDIVQFVRRLQATDGYNIEIIRPGILPKEVVKAYGFPLVSKELSRMINDLRYCPGGVKAKRARGEIECSWKSAKLPKKYEFLVNATFDTSHKCCYFLKKKPFRQYESHTGLHPILGTMAAESQQRTAAYIRRGGCNSFERKIESLPLSIWTEQDIFDYMAERKLTIADIYSKGAKRTGCMFCGFGCQMPGDNRFTLLKALYPKFYALFMEYENKGVKYRDALNMVLTANNLEPLE